LESFYLLHGHRSNFFKLDDALFLARTSYGRSTLSYLVKINNPDAERIL